MPEHKMVVVDGIRYRPEDAPALPEPAEESVTAPEQQPDGPDDDEGAAFDPAAHTAPDVLAHLSAANDDERERVLAAEAAGKARKGILEASFLPPGTSGGTAS
ncbi:hypothetical protein ACFYS8_13415 [Kitasatospora sp. NPDC004615]|uniref:hypothetical protein n=1 Tax=Kitasatospora sp. NPDC004615 TaxID=3364017 RepID=UPI00369E55A8